MAIRIEFIPWRQSTNFSHGCEEVEKSRYVINTSEGKCTKLHPESSRIVHQGKCHKCSYRERFLHRCSVVTITGTSWLLLMQAGTIPSLVVTNSNFLVVKDGLGTFLYGWLIQLAIYNHCLFSLSATRVTTPWLICFAVYIGFWTGLLDWSYGMDY